MKKLNYYLILLTTILVFGGCATKAQKLEVKKTDDGWLVEQEQPGISELKTKDVEVKIDTKKEPFRLFDLKPRVEIEGD